MKRATDTPTHTLLTLMLAVFLLAGCSGLLTSDKDAKRYYLLQPYTAWPSIPKQADDPSLSLSVTAIPGLDSDRILALGPDAQLNHYANARWPDHLPEVLTSVMQRSLEASGRFSTVQADSRTSPESWSLQLQARAFYGVQDDAGATRVVQVALGGEIECEGRQTALVLADSVNVPSERLASIVAAHQTALDKVTRQLLERIEAACGGPDRK